MKIIKLSSHSGFVHEAIDRYTTDYNNHEIYENIKTQCIDIVMIDNWLSLAFDWLWKCVRMIFQV